MPIHHDLDPYPIPKDKEPLFVNETWIADAYGIEVTEKNVVPADKDNVRVFVPLDINRACILQRLRVLINKYGEANEDNEFFFGLDVSKLISQIEIYDQIWYVRDNEFDRKHSQKAIDLVREFVEMLEDIPDGCAEMFPFETIDELRSEYLME